jgi:periplasmic divalent cation tolerance protein
MTLVKGLVQVVTAVPERTVALDLAGKCVESELAACVQVSGPVTSVYRWKGDIQREEEWICTMKTPGDVCGDLVSFVRERHPYETPEILVFSPDCVHEEYMKWAIEVTGRA